LIDKYILEDEGAVKLVQIANILCFYFLP